ncbi:polymorphic toxin-type HINT domain-containing protein [Streptomyces sp. NPDC006530]|uniref:polymorphic toxin-type HINT domain-containing protein n=1 Tax=Streptomyces sp. NPDC006530 TaxID=3364750 RepID=UPI0036CE8B63
MLATNPGTGRTEAKPVSGLVVGSGQKDLVEITVDTDGPTGTAIGTVTATDGHPFWVADKHRWLEAKAIKVGDRLRTDNGELREVVNTRAWSETRTVHNLTVADFHTYYVGAGNATVLVHNANKKCNLLIRRVAVVAATGYRRVLTST